MFNSLKMSCSTGIKRLPEQTLLTKREIQMWIRKNNFNTENPIAN